MGLAKSERHKPSPEVYFHKLFAPPEHKGAIRRDAILNKICVEYDTRVVLFQGPAGHGKSTLLQQAKSASGARGILTGWLTFDEADNDMHRVFLHLQALLASVQEEKETRGISQVEDVGTAGRWRRLDWFINRLIEIGKPVHLFFDEFQTLTDKSILAFFRGLLERIPTNVTIFIGSRTIPDIGLARLVVNNQAVIVRPDELRFSPLEVAQFFAEAGDLKIRKEEVEAIYKQTEGWPAALQLFRLTLVNPSVRESLGNLGTFRLPELAEYLADNVLVLQTPRIQEFLLRTSLLTRLSGPLCDAVTGWNDSQNILLFLERSGLFVRSLDSELQWFRYHSLFSFFLQEQLRHLSEDTIILVHQRASEWYREHGLFEEAMHHAVAAHDYGSAADIMDVWSCQLIAEAYLMTVERWYERLPIDEIEKRPDLTVKIAWALTFLRRHQKLRPILDMLERQERIGQKPEVAIPDIVRAMAAILVDDLPRSFEIIRRVEVRGHEPEGFLAFELGAASNLRGYQALTACDFDSAREYLALGRAYSDRANATFSWAYAISNIGINLIIQGLLKEALERFKLGIAEPKIYLDESFASASLVSCYVHALYEANDLDTAESKFSEFQDVISEAALLDYLAVAYVSMARIHDIRGGPAQASAVLDEAENTGYRNNWPRLIRIVNWERVRRALLRGDVDWARSAASRIKKEEGSFRLPEGWIPFSEDTEGDFIGEIRLAIHESHADDAIRLVAKELAIAQKKGRVRRQIKLHVLAAVAHSKKGADNVAHRSLRKALELAERGRFVRIFLDEGESVIQLLRQEYQPAATVGKGSDPVPGASREFVEILLNASGIDFSKTHVFHGFEPLEALTEREKEILIFLANGVSNKEMARKVYVSENTVKFHLKNIYSKLGVRNRLQAINAARQMGLI